MQTVSSKYNSILSGPHWTQTSLIIGSGTNPDNGYKDDVLIELKTDSAVFAEDKPQPGACPSAEIHVTMLYPSVTIPRMARLALYCRIANESEESEWLPAGVFYIDTREVNKNGHVPRLTLHGYDAMLKGEVAYPSSTLSWPAKDIDVVNEITKFLGIEMDSRTRSAMTKAYPISYQTEYTCREILGGIAALYGGCFVMSPAGKLLLVTMAPGNGSAISMGSNAGSLDLGEEFGSISKITVQADDDEEYTAGTDSGYNLVVPSIFGSQTVADNLLATLRGKSYQPFAAVDALLPIHAELGDIVTINGHTCRLFASSVTYDMMLRADISAPAEKAIDHEYPYVAPDRREIKRLSERTKSEFRVQDDKISAAVSAQEEITQNSESRDSELERKIAELNLKADEISTSVSKETERGDELEKQMTEFVQDSSKFEQRISKIETDGVNKVTTENGTTLDDSGFHVWKAGEPTQTDIDHQGVEVTRTSDGEAVLHVKDDGVNALNVTVRKWLIAAGSRLEAYSDSRSAKQTGLFYIGGT